MDVFSAKTGSNLLHGSGVDSGPLASAGDLDGDRSPEILVGDLRASIHGVEDGRVLLDSGADGSLIQQISGLMETMEVVVAVDDRGDQPKFHVISCRTWTELHQDGSREILALLGMPRQVSSPTPRFDRALSSEPNESPRSGAFDPPKGIPYPARVHALVRAPAIHRGCRLAAQRSRSRIRPAHRGNVVKIPHVRLALATTLPALMILSGCTSSNPVCASAAKLMVGMTKEEVASLMGSPAFNEWIMKDRLSITYWSYLIETDHTWGRDLDVYECITFTNGRVSDRRKDYGPGPHSKHLEFRWNGLCLPVFPFPVLK
jgi:hypothetical protein